MFDKSQIRSFVKQAKEEAGAGWSMLGPRIQKALISERALYVIAGQAAASVPVDTICALQQAMLAEAGLADA